MAKSFKVPFAFTGDKTTVPVALQPDGSVSYTQGFGPDYELDKLVDPINAKDVPRDQTNQLFFDVTESLGEVQKYGAAIWSADMAPYPINARVAYDDKYWRSNIAVNSDEPGVGPGWDDISAPSDIAQYGIGTNTPPQIGNLDDPAKLGGLYRYSSASDTGTNPTGGALNGVVLVQPYSATLSRQTFMEVTGGAGITSTRIWIRQINAATLGTWKQLDASASETVVGMVELATAAETAAGTSTSLATHPSGVAAAYALKQSIYVTEEQATGVSTGNNLNGLNIRALNTVRSNTVTGASLASSQITLPSGTYRINGSSPFFNGDQHRVYFYNVTDAAIVSLGTSENAGSAFTTRSIVRGKFTIASTKVFELRHWMPVAQTRGLGDPVNDGQPEVYAEIEIIREGN